MLRQKNLWRTFLKKLVIVVPPNMNLYLQSLIQRRDDLACLEYPFTKEEINDVVRTNAY
jgi:hypothetical protein